MTEQNIFDRGISKVRGVVSDTSIEQRGFMRSFIRLCNDGYNLGWHEANGGNLSYRMRPDEVSACRGYFNEIPGEWIPLGVQADSMKNAVFVVTGSGSHFRNMQIDSSRNLGIVEINSAGDSFRIVWGLKDGGSPTSEFACHFMNHAVRKVLTNDANRVIYHAHPANINALTLASTLDDRSLTRLLWKSMSESLIMFPAGVGLISWKIPGSPDLAVETSRKMETYNSVVLEQHGAFTAGVGFDDAFALMHTIDKAAEVCIKAHSLRTDFDFESSLSDENLRSMATALKLPINESFLD